MPISFAMEGKNKNKCLFVILEMEYCCKIESKMSLVRYFETMKTQLFHEAEKKSIFPEIQFQFNSRQIYGLKQKKSCSSFVEIRSWTQKNCGKYFPVF